MRSKTVRNVIIFSSFAILCGWVGKAINDPQAAIEQGPGTLIWLATPLLVSLILRAFAGDGWKDFGLRPRFKGNGKWYILSIFVYPIVSLVVIWIGLLSGKIAASAFNPANRTVLFQAFTILLAGTVMKNLLEEFAFRGYLAPKVYSLKLNRLLSHCIVGLVWGAWHIPFLAYVFSYLDESAVTLIPRLLLGTIAASIVYGEIRLRTDSVWPAFLMHTIGGAFIGAFLLHPDTLKLAQQDMIIFSTGVEGILTIILFSVIGYLLMQKKIS